MKELERVDRLHLNAAEEWLKLGNVASASNALEKITPENRAHPSVLLLVYQIHARAGKWNMAAAAAEGLTRVMPDNPSAWIWLAISTRRKTGGGIQQAKDVLIEAKNKFPEEPQISYNLACYECQLGHVLAAKLRLKEAFDLADGIELRQKALNDPDLEPLRKEIEQIS